MFMTRLKRLPVISREHFRKTRTNYLILVSQIPICKMESQILALKQQEEEQQQSGYKSRASTKYVLAAKNSYDNTGIIFKDENANISVYAIHPGVVITDLFRHWMDYSIIRMLMPIAKPFMKTAWHGAQTALYCLLDDSIGAVLGSNHVVISASQ
jgi:hypothetical protein